MSAALIDLVSVGAQDVYITGDPQVSFFRQNYKRHTNFAIKPERIDYVGTFKSSNEISIPIKSKGDLLSYVWIENANINSTNSNDSIFKSAAGNESPKEGEWTEVGKNGKRRSNQWRNQKRNRKQNPNQHQVLNAQGYLCQ